MVHCIALKYVCQVVFMESHKIFDIEDRLFVELSRSLFWVDEVVELVVGWLYLNSYVRLDNYIPIIILAK